MIEKPVRFLKDASISVDLGDVGPGDIALGDEPTTCTDAEPFALRVLDDSMEPEFRKGCVIIVDPTGRATDGSYVLAEKPDSVLFRQLKHIENDWTLRPLNTQYPSEQTGSDFSEIIGVIVQRAGVRRSYHKSYDQ